MKPVWTPTKLSEILIPISRSESVDPTKEYRLLGIRLEGNGPFHRETKLGSQVSASTLSQVKAGDFIYSRLFAWRGAFGLIDDELDGCYVSGEFPTFKPIDNKLDIDFLRLWFRLPSIISKVEANCTGSTPLTRNRFKEHFFLAMEISLPPLSEQRRIVARIEELAAKIKEAQKHRQKSRQEVDWLLSSALKKIIKPQDGWETFPISKCSTMSTGTTPPSYRSDYYGGEIQWYTPGDLSFSKTLTRSSKTVSDLAVKENKARIFPPETILLVAIGGSLGKVGLTSESCSSNQQITGIRFSAGISPDYGYWWMRSLYSELRAAAPQTTLPIINQKRIGEFLIAIPSIREQRQIVARLDDFQSTIDSLIELQSATTTELDALLPALLDRAFKGELGGS